MVTLSIIKEKMIVNSFQQEKIPFAELNRIRKVADEAINKSPCNPSIGQSLHHLANTLHDNSNKFENPKQALLLAKEMHANAQTITLPYEIISRMMQELLLNRCYPKLKCISLGWKSLAEQEENILLEHINEHKWPLSICVLTKIFLVPFLEKYGERIESLNLDFEMTDEEFKKCLNLCRQEKLRWIKISSKVITGFSLEAITRFKSLVFLNLEECKNLTDNGIEHLKHHPSLSELRLGGLVSDKGLEVILSLPEITTVYVTHCRSVTTDGLNKVVHGLHDEKTEIIYSSSLITKHFFPHQNLSQ